MTCEEFRRFAADETVPVTPSTMAYATIHLTKCAKCMKFMADRGAFNGLTESEYRAGAELIDKALADPEVSGDIRKACREMFSNCE